MPRPRKFDEGTTGYVHLMVPNEVLERLDAWVTELQEGTPGGAGITRSDLMRDVLMKALDAHDASAPVVARSKPAAVAPADAPGPAPRRSAAKKPRST